MKVSTIIVLYNAMSFNWLEQCIKSLLASTIKSDIILIDNYSNDNSVKFVEENYSNIITLIKMSTNAGFGSANNEGLRLALERKSDYFFLLNQDATITPTTIETLIDCSKQNPQYGIISPIHLNSDGSAFDLFFSHFVSPEKCPGLLTDKFLGQSLENIYPINFVNAAAWLLTYECVKKIGGFSPTFYHYGEDDNYCQRVLYKGLKIGICPFSFIYHDRKYGSTTKFDYEIELIKRHALVDISNPFTNIPPSKKINQIRNKIIKSLVLFQNKDAKNYFNLFQFLQTMKDTISKNLQESRKVANFIFLK